MIRPSTRLNFTGGRNDGRPCAQCGKPIQGGSIYTVREGTREFCRPERLQCAPDMFFGCRVTLRPRNLLDLAGKLFERPCWESREVVIHALGQSEFIGHIFEYVLRVGYHHLPRRINHSQAASKLEQRCRNKGFFRSGTSSIRKGPLSSNKFGLTRTETPVLPCHLLLATAVASQSGKEFSSWFGVKAATPMMRPLCFKYSEGSASQSGQSRYEQLPRPSLRWPVAIEQMRFIRLYFLATAPGGRAFRHWRKREDRT